MKTTKSEIQDLTFTVLERAVIYARVSGDDRGKEGRNLAGQLEMGREYAQGKGLAIVAELAEDDRGASGAEIDLPQLNRVREMAQKGEFDVLIVREIDRLSRNLAKQLIIEEELKKAGVRVEYVLAEYDDTPEGRLNKHIRATIAEYEREKIKERMVRGKRNKVKDGNLIRNKRPVYGYEYAEDGNSFLIVEAKTQVVKDIFRMFLEGMGTFTISNELNRLGVPTPAGGKQWRPSTIRVILTNRAYIGEWVFGRVNRTKKHVPGFEEKRWVTTKNPESHHLTVTIPAIITPETFEAAQEQFKLNFGLSKRNTKYEYLLGRRLKCQCGAAFVGQSAHRGRYRFYRCGAMMAIHGYNCDVPQIATEKLDGLVWAELEEYMHDPEKLRRTLTEYQEEISEVTQPLQDRLGTIDGLLVHWQKEWQNTIDSIRATKSEKAKALFSEELERVEATIAGLEKEREEISTQLEAQGMSDDQINTILDYTRQAAADWEEISQDPDSKRAFIDLLNIRVTIIRTPEGKRKGLLIGKFPGEPKEFCIDDSTKCNTVSNAKPLYIKLVIDLD